MCDPRGVRSPLVLSWWLGADQDGARQASYRVCVTSVDTGRTCWDTGVVHDSRTSVAYDGETLAPGETCVWFVQATNDAGEVAYAPPAAFVVARDNDAEPTSANELCRGIAWSTDASLCGTWTGRPETFLREPVWHDVLGLQWDAMDGAFVRIAPCADADAPAAVQGSVLLESGLVVVRLERRDGGASRVEVTLPPGMHGVLEHGGTSRELVSGRYNSDTN